MPLIFMKSTAVSPDSRNVCTEPPSQQVDMVGGRVVFPKVMKNIKQEYAKSFPSSVRVQVQAEVECDVRTYVRKDTPLLTRLFIAAHVLRMNENYQQRRAGNITR